MIQIDAFTTISGQGNPAGVVYDGDMLSTEQMQFIAKEAGYNETVFICSSKRADVKLRYFTPGHETPLCGHATVAAVYSLCEGNGDKELSIETKAGILPIAYTDKSKIIKMTQAAPKFKKFAGDSSALCQSIGISIEDLHAELPIEYGNIGSWTLLVPVKTPKILDKMIAHSKQFPLTLTELPKASIHPFAIVSQEKGIFSARHFSSPFSGTIEDSVTGTASGVIGAYVLNHIYPSHNKIEIKVQQGKHVHKLGEVFVHVEKTNAEPPLVTISGNACFNKRIPIMPK